MNDINMDQTTQRAVPASPRSSKSQECERESDERGVEVERKANELGKQ